MDTPSQQNLNQLPIGSTLGDFTITGIVGEGGFGIVYLAYEAALDRVVAIKEYLPSSIAGRTGNQSVMVRSQLNSNAYASGLKNFLREAQMLAKFSHAALVEVHRVWEQNSTAYMAMRFYDGKTLREWRLVNEDFDETRIRRLLEPVFDALSLLHAQNVIHRDVSPDNILMRGSGTPVLLDLGAARLVIGGMTQALTTILKPGYAPIEQYVDDGTMPQGPWTDVYGLGAVLYYMLTGVAPPQAVARMITDPLRNIANVVRVPVPEAFLESVVKSLAVRPENRFQSVDELRDALGWTDPLPAEPRTQYARTEYATRGKSSSSAVSGTGPVTTGSLPVAAPVLPTAVVRTPTMSPAQTPTPTPAPYVAAAVVMPAMTQPPVTGARIVPVVPSVIVPDDDDKTVIWKAAAVTAPKAVPPPPAARPPVQPAEVTRTKAYGDAPAGASKTWMFVALAAVVAAAGGYFAFNRPPSTTPAPPVPAVVEPKVTPPAPASPPLAVAPPAPSPSVAAAPSPVPAPPAPVKTPIVVAPPPVVAPAPGSGAEEERIARAKQEARDKARLEVQDKAAKAKSDADDRAKKLRVEAEERTAALRAEQEEKARRAREDEERQAAARAKQEADRVKATASVSPPGGGLVVTPVRRTVEELSSLGSAAFKRGDVAAARVAWNELVTHPEATARSKAIAFNNLAVSYCQGGDESNCERMYASMLRADRAYGSEVSEREMAQFKRAYDRAARQVRGPGY